MLGEDFEKTLKEIGTGAAVFSLTGQGCLTFLLVSLALTVTTVLAFRSSDGSFSQSVFVELAAGIAIFVAAPGFLRLGVVYKGKFHLYGVFVAVAVGVLAYFTSGALQSLLLEASVGILVLMALEIALRKWLDRLDDKAREIGKVAQRGRVFTVALTVEGSILRHVLS